MMRRAAVLGVVALGALGLTLGTMLRANAAERTLTATAEGARRVEVDLALGNATVAATTLHAARIGDVVRGASRCRTI